MANIPKDIAALHKRFETLRTGRANWETHWQQLADYMLPRRADITKTRAEGDKRTELIYDGTALHAVELLAASLHGMLTSPSIPWFSLRYRDMRFQDNDAANEWLEAAQNQMYMAFNRSNFQQEIHEMYYDLVTFGTACLFVRSDGNGGMSFSARHIAEIYISENQRGVVDTVYRKFSMSARAIALEFGEENLPDKIKKSLKEEPYKEHPLVHVVFPVDNTKADLFANINKPIASITYCFDSKMKIREGGFDEMPLLVPRFNKDSSSSWGRSPGMNCLSDTKMVNKMSEITIRSAQKQLDPPLMVPDDGFLLPVRTTPGSLNFYRSGTRDRMEPMQIGANNSLGLNMEEQRRNAIRQAFYVDQLLLDTGPQMTATEVLSRQEQRMRLLGPVLGRLQSELLQPLIDRSFALMLRQGSFTTPPEELQGLDIDIEYVSPLAKAQKQSELQNTLRGVEVLSQMAQIAPVLDYLDSDKMVRYLIDVMGLPAEIIRSSEEIAMVRRQQQQQQAAEQQMAQQLQEAEVQNKVAPFIKAQNQVAEQ